MEGRRSRSKPAEVDPGNAHVSPLPAKSTGKGAASHVSPAQAKSGAKVAVTHVDVGKDAVDDRYVPTVGGENKRKRAPRGPAGRNLKAKVECVNEDEAKVDSAPAADEEVSGSQSARGFRESHGGHQVLRKEEDKSGTENDESQEGGVNSKEQVEKRRGSSRLRIRPSKFRESFPVSSSKVKGEAKSSEDNSKSVEVVLATPPSGKSKDDQQAVQLVPSQVDTRELIARIFSKRKENKSKSSAVKDKALSTSAPVVSQSPDKVGLKAVLLALKRVMKMKEADPFNKPVDPIKLGIPDYLEVIKKPMDLGTIRDRLEKGEVYNTVDDIFKDVALVWSNCRQYNDDGDPIVGLLQNLESTFNKLCLAAGFSFHATNSAEANFDKSIGEDIQQQKDDQVKVPKKTKAKVTQPDVGTLLKTKIKRSAPVDQVMAESKAREQKDNAEEPNLGDLERDVKNAVESSSGADKQVETPQAEHESEDEEMHDDIQEPLQGPVETPPLREEESAPTRHRKPTNSQHINMPAKVKRPNGHSTLTHRQGCLCVVCVGRRKREAKLRKSGAHAKSNKSAKKKSGGLNSGDMEAEADEDFAFTEDGEDALNGYPLSDNVQGYTLNNYQPPLRKLDPYVVEMSRVLLGSKPGSIWNRPRSLGYVAVPLPGRSIGIADAISFLSKSH
ncbi:hypothetical protein M758_4G131100 [Ceratodon purpureus]|nr:hypothetical protein M758_4G131100 [Ceratodon purpureus]